MEREDKKSHPFAWFLFYGHGNDGAVVLNLFRTCLVLW